MDEEIGFFLGLWEVENGKDGEIVKAETEAILRELRRKKKLKNWENGNGDDES